MYLYKNINRKAVRQSHFRQNTLRKSLEFLYKNSLHSHLATHNCHTYHAKCKCLTFFLAIQLKLTAVVQELALRKLSRLGKDKVGSKTMDNGYLWVSVSILNLALFCSTFTVALQRVVDLSPSQCFWFSCLSAFVLQSTSSRSARCWLFSTVSIFLALCCSTPRVCPRTESVSPSLSLPFSHFLLLSVLTANNAFNFFHISPSSHCHPDFSLKLRHGSRLGHWNFLFSRDFNQSQSNLSTYLWHGR